MKERDLSPTLTAQNKDNKKSLNNKYLPLYFESREVEWVRKKIEKNKAYLAKFSNEYQFRTVQGDTLFLENEILPIILNNTMLHHSEVAKHFLRAFDSAIRKQCNGVLVYVPIREDYENQPVIGISNCREGLSYGTPGAIEIEIVNIDGNGAKVKPINLNLNDL